MPAKNTLYASLSAISAGILLSFVLHSPNSVPNIYSDIISFWGRSWVSGGQFPYISNMFEYPVISGLILYASRIIGGTEMGYYETFSAFSFVAALVVGWSSWRIAKLIGKEVNPVFFIMPSIIIYGIYNFDLFHVMFILLSLLALLMGRKSLSGVALGLAVATKLTSVVLAPIYFFEIKGWHERIKFLVVTIGVIAVFNVPFMVINFGTWFQTFTFLKNWGLEDAWFVWIFQNSSTWSYAKIFGLAVMALLLLNIYASKASLVTKSFLALAAYLLGTYIYAPQFNLLLIPFVAILSLDNVSTYLWDAFNALIILTWFIWPNPTHAGTVPQLFALLRDISLVGMCLALLRKEGLWTTTLRSYASRISLSVGQETGLYLKRIFHPHG